MKVQPLKINDMCLLEEEVFQDNRGSFEVFWESEWVTDLLPDFSITSAHHSYNRKSGTIRGLHYQASPDQQTKIVSCVAGKVWDVVVDMRKNSTTYLKWSTVELEAGTGRSLMIPGGCAHGFVTLMDCTTIAYLIDGEYEPSSARTVRWDDPLLNIPWPVSDPILSERDRNSPMICQ
ncbi:MAG: dTDP-4-dehydrorhamnose 3,5-epimerase [Gammaproteobacteria bacterium]|nr:MAG: dTDP-4-dehydrorhamnose 3,5-epimerase [Gammaproteobacteria bacterium]